MLLVLSLWLQWNAFIVSPGVVKGMEELKEGATLPIIRACVLFSTGIIYILMHQKELLFSGFTVKGFYLKLGSTPNFQECLR